MGRFINNILTKNKLFFLLLLVGLFLRLYRLEEFITFLGDQGRDAIIIKRIITLEHWPAIGPVSSVGQVFLGPFFYYLMSPFLLLFNFNPVGLAFGTALLSVIFLTIFYFWLKKIDKILAIFFVFLVVFSSILVQSARFSWNPNLLPYFSFTTLYFFAQFFKTKKPFFIFLTGIFYAFCIQLHYLALFLILPISFFSLFNFKYLLKEKSLSVLIKEITLFFLGFVLVNLPLILFDLKNNFLNSKNFIHTLTQVSEAYGGSFWQRFWETNINFFKYIFNFEINQFLILIILLSLFFGYFILPKKLKNDFFIKINFFNFFLYLFVFACLNSFRFWHYYQQIYLSFFLILAVIGYSLFKKNYFFKFLIILFLIFFIKNQLAYYPFLKKEGNFQTRIAQKIANSIINNNPQTPYQIVPIPFTEIDFHVRYFLEIMGKRPLDYDSAKEGKEIYVLCYEKECDVLNHPQWQIAAFKNKKVDKIWLVDRVKIYKVVHGK